MKTTLSTTLSAILCAAGLTANTAGAESLIDKLCGPGHVNEAAEGDVTANPDGYYIRSLQTQLRHGDVRIVQAVGRVYHLCTRSAATPDMDETKAGLLMEERAVSVLFVPSCPKTGYRGL